VTTDETDDTTSPATHRRRRILIWGGVGLLAVLVVAGALLWWFLRDDAPSAANIDDAADQARAAATTPDTEATDDTGADTSAGTGAGTVADTVADTGADTSEAGDAAGATGIDGTWAVDTSVGEFSFEDSTGTFVGFRVQEELSAIGSTTAVGRTPEVSGSLQIDGTTVTDVNVEADMTAITTNDSRRDGRVQSALDTSEFPTATFRTTEPIELGAAALGGEAVSVPATGELTIHGVTMPVTIPIDAQLVDDTIVVVGKVDVVFADYGVSPPSAPIVLSVSDDGEIEFQLFFTR